jgi:hypothetical protein
MRRTMDQLDIIGTWQFRRTNSSDAFSADN